VQVGGAFGSDSMEREGKGQHAKVGFFLSCYMFYPPLTIFLQGETEKTAQAADAADGLYTQMAGKANAIVGSVMDDKTKEASGELPFPSFVLYAPRFFHSSLSSLSARIFHSTNVLFPRADSCFRATCKKPPVKPRKRPTSLFRVVFYSCTMA
jgi:uncharacterized protein YjbJ (UPF0337 family)